MSETNPIEAFRFLEEKCRELRSLWGQADAINHPEADNVFKALEEVMGRRLVLLDEIRKVVPRIPDVEPEDRQFGITEFRHLDRIATALTSPGE